jgi:hypothetical protein
MRAPLVLLASALTAPALAGDDAEITPLVQLQLWGTVYDQDEDPQADPAGYGDPEHDPGFSIRRGRVGIEGRKGPLDFQLDFGLSAPYDAVAAQAQGGARPRFEFANAFGRGSQAFGPFTGRLSFGIVRVPFTRERIMSSRELTFQERAVGTAWIGPAQDLGVLADLEHRAGPRIQVGVYNGGGDLFGDDNPGVMLAGRVEYARGDTYRTYGEADDIDIGVAAAGYWNRDVATETVAVEGDALIRVWRFALLTEVSTALIRPGDPTIDLPDVLDPTRRLGVTGQLSYWQPIGPPTDAVAARSAVEIAVQVATFDDNTALSDNGNVAVAHAGATWRNAWPGVDVGAAYIHRQELAGRDLPNDTIRIYGQLRWPPRGVITTATSTRPADVEGPDIPSAEDVHPTGDR